MDTLDEPHLTRDVILTSLLLEVEPHPATAIAGLGSPLVRDINSQPGPPIGAGKGEHPERKAGPYADPDVGAVLERVGQRHVPEGTPADDVDEPAVTVNLQIGQGVLAVPKMWTRRWPGVQIERWP